jgi:hypothetical protein
MNISKKQIEAVISLSGDKRYTYFIKMISDWETVWGLYNEGWALSETDEGDVVFPLWPAKEYSDLCAIDEWSEYKSVSFTLESFIEELLPNLNIDSMLPCIFSTSKNDGVIIPIEQLLQDIEIELEKY